MADRKKTTTDRRIPPARTIEERENQMINLAIDRAYEQLRDGTASSQVITHYLKLGSTQQKLEKELLLKQIEHLNAKIDAIHSSELKGELYEEAIKAMRKYTGTLDDDE